MGPKWGVLVPFTPPLDNHPPPPPPGKELLVPFGINLQTLFLRFLIHRMVKNKMAVVWGVSLPFGFMVVTKEPLELGVDMYKYARYFWHVLYEVLVNSSVWREALGGTSSPTPTPATLEVDFETYPEVYSSWEKGKPSHYKWGVVYVTLRY
jgi:hypothetical protein